MGGLASVFERFTVDYFVRSDKDAPTEGYQKLMAEVARKHVPVKFVTQGEHIAIGATSLSVLWPSEEQIAKAKPVQASSVLGASAGELNDYSLVLAIRYGTFDAMFPGDADSHVEAKYNQLQVFGDPVEFLKVPHHGSKTGMTLAFIDWLKPQLAVISVGKNSYGHPSAEAVDMLQSVGSRVLRTDKQGYIEVVSDGGGGLEGRINLAHHTGNYTLSPGLGPCRPGWQISGEVCQRGNDTEGQFSSPRRFPQRGHFFVILVSGGYVL